MYFANIICWPQVKYRRRKGYDECLMENGFFLLITLLILILSKKTKLHAQSDYPSWHFYGMKSEAKTETDT